MKQHPKDLEFPPPLSVGELVEAYISSGDERQRRQFGLSIIKHTAMQLPEHPYSPRERTVVLQRTLAAEFTNKGLEVPYWITNVRALSLLKSIVGAYFDDIA